VTNGRFVFVGAEILFFVIRRFRLDESRDGVEDALERLELRFERRARIGFAV
jgi:hypothetical protein